MSDQPGIGSSIVEDMEARLTAQAYFVAEATSGILNALGMSEKHFEQRMIKLRQDVESRPEFASGAAESPKLQLMLAHLEELGGLVKTRLDEKRQG